MTGSIRSTTTPTRRRRNWPTSTRSTAIRSRTRSRHCDGGSRHSCWPAWPLVLGSTVALLLARRLGRSITRPLLSLKDAATRFGSDDLSHRIPVSGDDELAQLGNAFNAMASSLQGSRADLRESEQRFRALVHHASDVFTVIGADGVIRYQSPAIEQVLGYPTEAIIGRSFLNLIDPHDQDIARCYSNGPSCSQGCPPSGRSICGPARTCRRPGISR